jgi:ribosomal protein S27E
MKTKTEKEIVGFFDVTCPDCQKRYGWYGKMTSRPDCPKCGHNITPQEQEDGQSQIRQLDIFCIVQRLWYDCQDKLATTEKLFIKNMYTHHRRRGEYTKTQQFNIRRIARNWGVLE